MKTRLACGVSATGKGGIRVVSGVLPMISSIQKLVCGVFVAKLFCGDDVHQHQPMTGKSDTEG